MGCTRLMVSHYSFMVADLLSAGADTISVSLSWMFVTLSHHPQVQKKLHAEIDDFVKSHGRLPTFEERDQFPFLISVQKECMASENENFFDHILTSMLSRSPV